jgi:hypothetical protein
MTISTLIDKQDTFEIVRDQIAAILVNEVANQQALAVTAGKDPALWKLRIYLERSNPWEQWLNLDDITDRSPLVSVWFDSSSVDLNASNSVRRQKFTATYNIDCYGLGVSSDDGATGQIAGDKEASFESQRAVRLVRNILMAGENTRLQLEGTVADRSASSIAAFQPELNARQAQRIIANRIRFEVSFNEFSPQVESRILETLTATVNHGDDGEVLLVYDYTT